MKIRENKFIALALLAWWDKNRREMPWRARAGKAPNPYHVLVSEFMLQQTTVTAVTPYFKKFIKKWPSFKALAAAELEEVRAAWAGLGYYRRAAFLHNCARTIVKTHGGHLPENEEALQELPGIGPYTAAMLRAILFNKKANVVDGNVERVVARLFAIKEKMPAARAGIRAKAETLLPEKRCGDYAQALMDLGSTICTPRTPQCSACPLEKNCAAFKEGVAEKYPRKEKAKKTPLKKTTMFVLIDKKRHVLLRRRAEGGLFGGLWEFPSTPWEEVAADKKTEEKHAPAPIKWQKLEGPFTHVFSHFKLEVSLRLGHSSRNKTIMAGQDSEYRWHAWEALRHTAVPSLMLKVAARAKAALKENA